MEIMDLVHGDRLDLLSGGEQWGMLGKKWGWLFALEMANMSGSMNGISTSL